MESKFKSLSVFEFQKRFGSENQCLAYLAEHKWSSGYSCNRCGHRNYCNGNKRYERQCTHCRYIESPTANTLFHKVKFPLVKAFWVVYCLSTSKKGIASTELSRKLQLRQKTCWLFKQKVMRAMRSSQLFPMSGQVEVDETYVGGQDDKAVGRNEGKKKIVVVSIEKKGKGVSRMYGRVIKTASRKNLKKFMKDHIDKDAKIRTDGWTGYQGLSDCFPKLTREKSQAKGKNFRDLHRTIMIFKAWLRGIHHSVRHLQPYLDEYCFRFNRQKMKEGIFENLMNRMIEGEPYPYKLIIA